jgi:MFS family permease
VLNERVHPHPIIPLTLFRNLPFVQAVTMTFFSAAGIFAGTQFLPTYVQTSLGGSAAASGLVVTPQAIGGLCTSIIGGQIISRTGRFKSQMILGCVLMTLAALILSRSQANEAEWRIGMVMVLLGFGTGLVFPVTQVVVQGAVSQDEQGVASSVRQFFNLVGQTLGVAALGLVLTTSYVNAFTRDSAGIAQTMPPAVYQQFKDPTLALDPVRYSAATQQILALPGGDATLAKARASQRQAVATAIDHVFIGTLLMILIVLALAISLREIRLRRSFDAEPEALRAPVAETI